MLGGMTTPMRWFEPCCQGAVERVSFAPACLLAECWFWVRTQWAVMLRVAVLERGHDVGEDVSSKRCCWPVPQAWRAAPCLRPGHQSADLSLLQYGTMPRGIVCAVRLVKCVWWPFAYVSPVVSAHDICSCGAQHQRHVHEEQRPGALAKGAGSMMRVACVCTRGGGGS